MSWLLPTFLIAHIVLTVWFMAYPERTGERGEPRDEAGQDSTGERRSPRWQTEVIEAAYEARRKRAHAEEPEHPAGGL